MKKYTEKDIKAIYHITFCIGYAFIDVIYDIDDFVVTGFLYNDILCRVTKNKIYTSNKGDYIVKYGKRVYLNEFMKVEM